MISYHKYKENQRLQLYQKSVNKEINQSDVHVELERHTENLRDSILYIYNN